MKVSIESPNTIYLSVWVQDDRTAITASCRKNNGCVQTNVLAIDGGWVWEMVVQALEDVSLLKMPNLIIFCNDEEFVQTWRRPIQLEPRGPDRMHLYNPHQWEMLRWLCGYNAWMVAHNENLKQARALWNEHQRSPASN